MAISARIVSNSSGRCSCKHFFWKKCIKYHYCNSSLSREIKWLTINPNQGMIIEGQSENVELMVNTNNLIEDTYNAYVSIQSNGGNATLPVILVVNGSLLGDANGDSTINVMDIIIMVEYIIYESNDYNLDCVDVNGDGSLSILDLVATIGIILGRSPWKNIFTSDFPYCFYYS